METTGEAGEKELVLAAAETAKRNAQEAVRQVNDIRKEVNKISKLFEDMNEKLSKVAEVDPQTIETMRKQLTTIQQKLFSGGTSGD